MENERFDTGGLWRVAASATLSVIAVGGVAWWQFRSASAQQTSDLTVTAADTTNTAAADTAADLHTLLGESASSTPEEISRIGPNVLGDLVGSYADLARRGAYTPALGAQIAASVAPEVDARIPYDAYEASAAATDPDTSYKRMRAYRTDLQKSLAPLLKNKSYELGLYASYVETRDERSLTQLKDAATRYREAASSTALVIVPKDAVQIHAGIINAMREFAATLDSMTANMSDPLTSLALLRAYNRAEGDMQSAFRALDAYYASKRP